MVAYGSNLRKCWQSPCFITFPSMSKPRCCTRSVPYHPSMGWPAAPGQCHVIASAQPLAQKCVVQYQKAFRYHGETSVPSGSFLPGQKQSTSINDIHGYMIYYWLYMQQSTSKIISLSSIIPMSGQDHKTFGLAEIKWPEPWAWMGLK